MKSGTEQNPNPHELPLGRFLRGRETHIRTVGYRAIKHPDDYVQLRNGQIVRAWNLGPRTTS